MHDMESQQVQDQDHIRSEGREVTSSPILLDTLREEGVSLICLL